MSAATSDYPTRAMMVRLTLHVATGTRRDGFVVAGQLHSSA